MMNMTFIFVLYSIGDAPSSNYSPVHQSTICRPFRRSSALYTPLMSSKTACRPPCYVFVLRCELGGKHVKSEISTWPPYVLSVSMIVQMVSWWSRLMTWSEARPHSTWWQTRSLALRDAYGDRWDDRTRLSMNQVQLVPGRWITRRPWGKPCGSRSGCDRTWNTPGPPWPREVPSSPTFFGRQGWSPTAGCEQDQTYDTQLPSYPRRFGEMGEGLGSVRVYETCLLVLRHHIVDLCRLKRVTFLSQ